MKGTGGPTDDSKFKFLELEVVKGGSGEARPQKMAVDFSTFIIKDKSDTKPSKVPNVTSPPEGDKLGFFQTILSKIKIWSAELQKIIPTTLGKKIVNIATDRFGSEHQQEHDIELINNTLYVIKQKLDSSLSDLEALKITINSSKALLEQVVDNVGEEFKPMVKELQTVVNNELDGLLSKQQSKEAEETSATTIKEQDSVPEDARSFVPSAKSSATILAADAPETYFDLVLTKLGRKEDGASPMRNMVSQEGRQNMNQVFSKDELQKIKQDPELMKSLYQLGEELYNKGGGVSEQEKFLQTFANVLGVYPDAFELDDKDKEFLKAVKDLATLKEGESEFYPLDADDYKESPLLDNTLLEKFQKSPLYQIFIQEHQEKLTAYYKETVELYGDSTESAQKNFNTLLNKLAFGGGK